MANIQVDQSVKMHDLVQDTVLVATNGVTFAVIVPASVKRVLMERLRQKGKSQSATSIYLFSIALYLLLRNVVARCDQIIVDVEYVGWEGRIRDTASCYLQKEFPNFDAERILFQQIGKKSRAHKFAIQITRKQRNVEKRLAVQDFLAALPKRK